QKDDIKYGTAQAKLSEDEVLRIRCKAGTPLEGGKIADSDPGDLFSGAHNISGEQRENQGGMVAESEPVDVFSSARNLENKRRRPDCVGVFLRVFFFLFFFFFF
ncbi:hypothetical protein ACP275_08G168200, partial [Erythranthe tilingii]